MSITSSLSGGPWPKHARSASRSSVLVFKPVVRGLMGELRIGAAEGMESPTGLLLVEKVMEVAQAMANDFLSGIARYSLALFVFATVVFAAAFVRNRLVSSRSG